MRKQHLHGMQYRLMIAALIQQPDYQTARKHWNKLKERLKKQGSQSVKKCHQLKLARRPAKNTRPTRPTGNPAAFDPVGSRPQSRTLLSIGDERTKSMLYERKAVPELPLRQHLANNTGAFAFMKHAALSFVVLFFLVQQSGFAPAAFSQGSTVVFPSEGLGLQRPGTPTTGSSRDVMESRLLEGTLESYAPKAGESMGDGGTWSAVAFDSNGALKDQFAYVYVPIESDTERPMVLNASGHSALYFNGTPRAGNVYGRDYWHLPVVLHPGTNHLLLRRGRQPVKVRLYAPPAPRFLHSGDLTLPDLVVGEKTDTWGAVVVINASPDPADGLAVRLRDGGLLKTVTPVPSIPPMSIRKVGFRIRGHAPRAEGDRSAMLELRTIRGETLHDSTLKLNVVAPDQNRWQTFISDIDGSVQAYGLRPAVSASSDDPAPGIVLSLHGAGVQARGQSAAYAPKSWLHVVAPTNRRPFGFDWEDFGRADAMEVLALSKEALRHDPARIYLTGHSMGGHGAWHLGVTYPDVFAAVGPSAGWISRASYSRRGKREAPQDALTALLSRGEVAGDTIALARNLKQQSVYILHGGADDNVPPEQAQRMAELLGEFHHDWDYHEAPDMGHWWSNDYGDNSNAGVDWPFMFDNFARHALPPTNSVRHVEFYTANPGVSSTCHWLGIEGQLQHHAISRAEVHCWPNQGAFVGTTENVAVLRLDLGQMLSKGPLSVTLDGQITDGIACAEASTLWFQRVDGQWSRIARPPLWHKGPNRYGAVKEELRHRFVFVYGTTGDAIENTWAFERARYDAETFWYRGNGAMDVLADKDFRASDYADRTVLLYGNADTNSAWSVLLKDSPIQVRRGLVSFGAREMRGDGLAAIFVRPRSDSDTASVVAVAGSGLPGMRATYRYACFVPARRYPDCLVTQVTDGNGEVVPVAAGYFGLDWSVEAGEFEYADDAAN